MAKKNSALKYKYIWKSQIVNESDQVYQGKLEPFSLRYSKDIDIFSSFEVKVFQKFGKLKGTSPYYLDFKSLKSNKIFHFYIGYVKNAGMATQDKRLQISPNIPNFIDQDPYYALGILPTGDDEIIVLVEMKDYVKNKIKSTTKNNSSLWIYYDNIISAYFDRKLVIQQDHDKKRYIFRRSQADIVEKVFNSIFVDSSLNEEEIEPAKVGELNVHSYVKLSRNTTLRDEVFKKANYKCELCDKTNTFQDKNQKWYFEAHHIIPFNLTNQKLFNLTLDHLSNLVCLCPECHRKVHFSSLKEQIISLETLLSKKPLFQKYYQINNTHDLLNFYKGEVE